jgi:hypothetical protein
MKKQKPEQLPLSNLHAERNALEGLIPSSPLPSLPLFECAEEAKQREIEKEFMKKQEGLL